MNEMSEKVGAKTRIRHNERPKINATTLRVRQVSQYDGLSQIEMNSKVTDSVYSF